MLDLVIQGYHATHTMPSAILSSWGAVMPKGHISPPVNLYSLELSKNELLCSRRIDGGLRHQTKRSRSLIVTGPSLLLGKNLPSQQNPMPTP